LNGFYDLNNYPKYPKTPANTVNAKEAALERQPLCDPGKITIRISYMLIYQFFVQFLNLKFE